jgi:hypothetical protein
MVKSYSYPIGKGLLCRSVYLGGGHSFRFQAGFAVCNTLIDFISNSLTGKAVLLLKHACQDFELAGCTIQIVVGEFSLPDFASARRAVSLSTNKVQDIGYGFYLK